jgi:hypothetical protein
MRGVTKRYPDGTVAVRYFTLDIAEVDGPQDDRRARGHQRG